jgi:hypothetical protein
MPSTCAHVQACICCQLLFQVAALASVRSLPRQGITPQLAIGSLKHRTPYPLTNTCPCCSNTREAWSDIWPATIGVAVMFITATLLLIKVTADLVHARRDYHMYHDYMYNNDAVTAAISTAYDTGDKGSYMRNVSSTPGPCPCIWS